MYLFAVGGLGDRDNAVGTPGELSSRGDGWERLLLSIVDNISNGSKVDTNWLLGNRLPPGPHHLLRSNVLCKEEKRLIRRHYDIASARRIARNNLLISLYV